MFNARIRMLGFVERWNIAPRLHRQSVAEHSYFVAMNVSTLAKWLDLPEWHRLQLIEYALRHDLAEIVTGDMPGPGKRAVVDKAKLADYETEFLQGIGEAEFLQDLTQGNRDIIKTADTIEAWFWCALEVARGNVLMSGELPIARDRAYAALSLIENRDRVEELWQLIEGEVKRLFGPIELSPRLDTDIRRHPDDECPF
jgi:5'-deoxynucleotidase YfbR-like HD superfamily hydrolase